MSRMTSPQNNWTQELRDAWLRELATRLQWGSFDWDAPNIPAHTSVTTTLTDADSEDIAALRPSMAVSITPPLAIDEGLVPTAWVPDNGKLTIRIANVTAGALNPAEGTWRFLAVLT